MRLARTIARLCALILVFTAIDCTSKKSDEEKIDPAPNHFRFDPRAEGFRTGTLIGWNIGRGTYYAVENDSFHPEWRDRRMTKAAQLLSYIQPAHNPKAWMRFSGLQIDGLMGGDGYHFWDYVSPNRVETDSDNMAVYQYMALMAESDSQPIVTLNYSSGTAQEAADYVRYLNGDSPNDPLVSARASHGRQRPYGQLLFEIGNEVYGVWNTGFTDTRDYSYANPEAVNGGDPPWHGQPASDPNAFAARALEYIEAVLEVEPNAIFWAPLSQATMEGWGDMDETFDALETLLLHPALNAVVIHQYTIDEAVAFLGLEDHNDPQFMVTGSEWFRAGFEDLRRRLDELDRRLPLRIAITEYHVADGLSRGFFNRGDQAILGLGIADLMITYAQLGIDYACQHMAINFLSADDPERDPLLEAWYNPFRDGGNGEILEMPTYHVNGLVAGSLSDKTIPLESNANPTLSLKVGEYTMEAPIIHAAAFIDDWRTRASILWLNRDLENAQTVTIELPYNWEISTALHFAPTAYDQDATIDPVWVERITWRQIGRMIEIVTPPASVTSVRLEWQYKL